MNVEKKGNSLVITLPLNATPAPSNSGKTKIVAGTGGFLKSDVEIDGKQVSVMVNATIPNS